MELSQIVSDGHFHVKKLLKITITIKNVIFLKDIESIDFARFSIL